MRDELARALIRPVRWRETFTALHEAGPDGRFVEVGPGKVLARLAKRIVPGTKVETSRRGARTMPETAMTPAAGRRPRSRPARTARVLGLGHRLPDRVVPNGPIAERIGVDADWIVRRTGIRARRHAAPRRAHRRPRARPPPAARSPTPACARPTSTSCSSRR